MTMATAAVSKDDGTTETITEFNGGINYEMSKRTAITLEAFVLNKKMSVFVSFVPKFYYILPWQLRLIPKSKTVEVEEDTSSDEEVDSDNEDYVEAMRQREVSIGSTMLEGGVSMANSRMWMLGCSHLLTRSLTFAYNFERSLIPVRSAKVYRYKNAVMLRHDVSKEVTTSISYTRIGRRCKEMK